MVVIQDSKDLDNIKDLFVYEYIHNLLNFLFETYEVQSIKDFGAICYVESDDELQWCRELYLPPALNDRQFEWIVDIGEGYVNGCLLIHNDFALNLVGRAEYIKNLEE